MTNRNMIGPEKARSGSSGAKLDEKDLGNEAVPDSPQLSPQIDEKRTRLQQPRSEDAATGNTPDKKRG
jgi:hypothetical protein